jgi:hypothetical protein
LAELFTSQGCSSCPPADALLGELAARSDVLALSFHVNYWNNLGWKDPYSFQGATDRQRRYARLLGAEIYTPQIVIDGQAETVGSQRASVEALLHRRPIAGVRAAIRASGGGFMIAIDGAALPKPSATAQILLVTFDARHKTAIGAGENGGRYLETYNDVRSLRSIGSWTGNAVTASIARDATEIGERACVIVQSGDGTIWAVAATEIGA